MEPTPLPFPLIPIPLPTSSTNPSRKFCLTPFHPTDIPHIARILGNPAISKELVGAPEPYTLKDAEWWVNVGAKGCLEMQALRIDEEGGEGADGKEGEKGVGRYVGCVSLRREKEGKEREGEKEGGEWWEIGYYLDPEFQGHSLMRHSVSVLIKWARDFKGVKNVTIKALEENLASQRVITGVMKDGWGFERGEDEQEVWPESKGGGVRTLRVWRLRM